MPRLGLGALLACAAAFAQPAPPAFDVASVKPGAPAPGDYIDINLGTATHGVVTMSNVTLSECIRWAYALESQSQVAGPAWINDRETRFDITAKSAPDTPLERLRLMMQALLAERFALKLHSEPKRLEHYELAVEKSGPKLPPTIGDERAFRSQYNTGRLFYSHITMYTLAVLLARQLKEIVLDRTALPGFYDVKLEWTPDDAGVAGVDIYRALRQQLGLSLERKNTPIDVLVVDSATKSPTAN